ncbi:hypothetical protein Hanom_Chr07g00668161 [Helianthus anomalus]
MTYNHPAPPSSTLQTPSRNPNRLSRNPNRHQEYSQAYVEAAVENLSSYH